MEVAETRKASLRDEVLREMEAHLGAGCVLRVTHRNANVHAFIRYVVDKGEVLLEWTFGDGTVHLLDSEYGVREFVDIGCAYRGERPEYRIWWMPFYSQEKHSPFSENYKGGEV